jgi:cell division protease FtsH
MSEKLGPVALLPADGAGPLLPGAGETSQRTQWLIDQEVERLVAAAYADVIKLLSDHRHQLDTLAAALLKAETLDSADAYTAAALAVPNSEPQRAA